MIPLPESGHILRILLMQTRQIVGRPQSNLLVFLNLLRQDRSTSSHVYYQPPWPLGPVHDPIHLQCAVRVYHLFEDLLE